MKTKNLFIIILLFSIGCVNQNKNKDFSKDAISLRLPLNWNITEQDDLDGDGYYLAIEKKGIDTSGLLTITWINGVLDSHEYLEIIKEEYANQETLNDLVFELEQISSFNGRKSISCNFKFNILSVKHRGVINVFLENEKTYSIIKQEALEDISENKEGFDLIESSFNIK